MNDLPFYRSTRLIGITLILCLLVGCSDSKREQECIETLQNTASDLRKCQSDYSAVLENSKDLESRISDLTKKINDLSQTADGLWGTVIGCSDDICAEQALQSFITKYPTEPRISEAKKRLITIQKKREEAERIAKLDSVTVKEIVADPQTYRKSLFSRVMCCWDFNLSNYEYPTTIAEINFRATKLYNALCHWRWKESDDGSPYASDIASRIELRLTQEQAKLLAKHGSSDNFDCRYKIRSTLFLMDK